MRWVSLVAVCVLAACATHALAHGGGPYRGPPGPPPPGVSEPWNGPPVPPPRLGGAGPVTGRVLDVDGAPLAGAHVWCDGSPVARVDADGRFRCAPLRYPATLVVTARGRAPQTLQATVRPAPGAHLDLGDVRLAAGGDLHGRVAESGVRPETLRIRVVPLLPRVPEEFAVAARWNGWSGVWVPPGRSFVFRGLPPGRYRLVAARTANGEEAVVADGVSPGVLEVVVESDDVPPEEPPETDALDGTLVLSGIGGRDVAVIDRERRVQVIVKHDVDRVELAVPSDSHLDVAVQDDAGILLPLEGLRAGQEVSVPPAAERTSVEGRVVRIDGSPVTRARIWAAAAADVHGAFRRETWTGADGRFRLDGVCGRLRVHAAAPGLTNEERPSFAMAGATEVLVIVEEERTPGE